MASVDRLQGVLDCDLSKLGFLCLLTFEVAPVVLDEAPEYVQTCLWLVHWHHVPSVEDPQEVVVSVLTHVADSLTIEEQGNK